MPASGVGCVKGLQSARGGCPLKNGKSSPCVHEIEAIFILGVHLRSWEVEKRLQNLTSTLSQQSMDFVYMYVLLNNGFRVYCNAL